MNLEDLITTAASTSTKKQTPKVFVNLVNINLGGIAFDVTISSRNKLTAEQAKAIAENMNANLDKVQADLLSKIEVRSVNDTAGDTSNTVFTPY